MKRKAENSDRSAGSNKSDTNLPKKKKSYLGLAIVAAVAVVILLGIILF